MIFIYFMIGIKPNVMQLTSLYMRREQKFVLRAGALSVTSFFIAALLQTYDNWPIGYAIAMTFVYLSGLVIIIYYALELYKDLTVDCQSFSLNDGIFIILFVYCFLALSCSSLRLFNALIRC